MKASWKVPARRDVCVATLTLLFFVGGLVAKPSSAEAASQTLGFVIPKWNFAAYQSKFWDECPEGAAISQDEVWWRSASKEVRSRVTNNGNIDANIRLQVPNHRGPNGEDVCWRPTLFKDPPIRQASGPISYGFNLDGSVDGQIAPGTCGHEKFATSPNGETHVDNQLYRAIGCHVGWRNFSIIDSYANEGRKSSGNGIVLIEITGVDDPKNDADVEVSFYKAVPAQFPRDPAGNILPFGSYHIETARGVPRYSATARGRIEKGVLTIAPRDVTLPYFGSLGAFGEMTFRKMNLRLEIASDGKTARGLVGGYRDVESWFNEVKDNEVESGHADFDCPALYEAVHKLADGYPDPKTNQCTAISSAYLIEAVAAFVIHPRETARE